MVHLAGFNIALLTFVLSVSVSCLFRSFMLHSAALIQGNHSNCTQFASSKHIDWLVRRLEGQDSSKGIISFLAFLDLLLLQIINCIVVLLKLQV